MSLSATATMTAARVDAIELKSKLMDFSKHFKTDLLLRFLAAELDNDLDGGVSERFFKHVAGELSEFRDKQEVCYELLKRWAREADHEKSNGDPILGLKTICMNSTGISSKLNVEELFKQAGQRLHIKIPTTVLLELAAVVGSHSEVLRLAGKLYLDPTDVMRISASMKKVENLAFDVFKQWSMKWDNTERGRPEILKKALLDIGRRDLADIFEQKLFECT